MVRALCVALLVLVGFSVGVVSANAVRQPVPFQPANDPVYDVARSGDGYRVQSNLRSVPVQTPSGNQGVPVRHSGTFAGSRMKSLLKTGLKGGAAGLVAAGAAALLDSLYEDWAVGSDGKLTKGTPGTGGQQTGGSDGSGGLQKGQITDPAWTGPYWILSVATGYKWDMPSNGCAYYAQVFSGGYVVSVVQGSSYSSYTCTIYAPGLGNKTATLSLSGPHDSCPAGYQMNQDPRYCYQETPPEQQALTDQDYDDIANAMDQAAAGTVNSVGGALVQNNPGEFGDYSQYSDNQLTGPSELTSAPRTTTTTRTNPDGSTSNVVNEAVDTTAITYGNNYIEYNSYTTNNTYVDGNPAGSSTTPYTPTMPELDLYNAAKWLDDHAMTPMASDDNLPSPFATPFAWQQQNVSLPSACPAPYTFSAMGTSVALSFQPFCDLALMIRGMVIAAAWLWAAYAMFGVTRSV